jgi:hypothetical protein
MLSVDVCIVQLIINNAHLIVGPKMLSADVCIIQLIRNNALLCLELSCADIIVELE